MIFRKKYYAFIFSMQVFFLYGQNWKHYDTSNSATPYNDYHRIAIDSSDKKWFTRIMGLGGKTVSFDNSLNWSIYNNTYSSTIFNARTIKVDRENNLWITSLSNNAFKFNSGSWILYDAANTGVLGMDAIYDMAVDENNIKWFATSYGLIKYNDTIFTTIDTSNSGLPFQPLHKIEIDKYDNIWLAGAGGLLKFDGSVWQVSSLPFSSVQLKSMVADSLLNLWFGWGSFGNGIYKYDGVTWSNYNSSNSGIPTNDIYYNICVDLNSNIWISYLNGLSMFDGNLWVSYDTISGFPYPNGGGGVLAVDRYNNKWNCSPSGVVVFNENGIVGRDDLFMNENNILIFPNPNNGVFELRSTIKDRLLSLEIYNILGDKISVMNDVFQKMVFDISNYPSGMYIVKAYTHEGTICKKIIKQ